MWSAPGIPLTVLAAAIFAVSGTAATELPQLWQVTTDGREGELVVREETQGRLEATLLDRPAIGLRAGAVVVLQREADGVTELWQGRLGRRPDGTAFLSGTISSGTEMGAFFAIERSELAAPSSAPSAIGNEGGTAAVSPPASEFVTPSVLSSQPLWSGFEGPWSTPQGLVMVARDGSSIEVTMPDGTVCEGRMTGVNTFVVGLRVACCKGELQGPDTIRWSDNTVWRREQ